MAASRLLAVLFTDLVASTETVARLGAEAGEVWRRRHLELLREALRAAGGREVQALGDGIFAAFESASSAVGAACAMQQRVTRANSRVDALAPTHIRIGIAAGEALEDAEGVHGLVVVEASRLCAAAKSDQVLASALVQTLSAGRTEHRFVPLGPLELKGLPEPVASVEVRWQQSELASSVPFPAALAAVARTSFVGRATEGARLEAAWTQAQAGERRLVLLAGEPGIGKTRLAAEFAERSAAGGATVLYGRTDEDLSAPFQPWVQALRHYVMHTAPEVLQSDLGASASDVARMVPELARKLGSNPAPVTSDPEGERLRLFDAIDEFVATISRAAPVLVVLDDLHWADKPSLVLLRHLARSTRPGAVLLLCTYRETDLARSHPLAEVLADLRREPSVLRVLLRGLGQEDVGALVTSRAEHDAPEAFVRALHVETDGNPFFVEEVLRHLTETGVLRREGGRWTSDRRIDELGIPEGIREVVGRRLSRLSEAANAALGIAAVIGRDFDAPSVEAGEGPAGEALLDALDEASRARLIVEVAGSPGRYSFAHALVRQTLYEELGTSRRALLHWRIGVALERRFAHALDEHASAIAHHLCEGVLVGDVVRAVTAALRAAELAKTVVAHEDVIKHARRGLAVLEQAGRDEPEQRFALLMLLAVANQFVGGGDYRDAFAEALEVARRSGWPERSADAVLGMGVLLETDPTFMQRLQVLEDAALAGLPPGDSTQRCRLLARLASHQLVGGADVTSAPLADEALAMARRLGDTDSLTSALVAKAGLRMGLAPLGELEELTEELLGLISVTREARLEIPARRAVLHLHAMRGDRTRFHAELARVELYLDRNRYLAGIGNVGIWTAADALARGRFEEARAIAAKIRDVGTSSWIDTSRLIFAMVVTASRLELGRHDRVLAGIVDFVATAQPWLRAYRCVLVSTRAQLGDLDQARVELSSLASDGFAALPRDWSWPLSLRHLAETCALLGDEPVARALEPELLPYSGLYFVAFAGSLFEGAADRSLGHVLAVQGRLDEACAHYERALALEEGFESTALAARTRYWWARALAERGAPGDLVRARELASACRETASSLGMARLESDAAAVARLSA